MAKLITLKVRKFFGLVLTFCKVTWAKTDKDLFCSTASWIGFKHQRFRVEGRIFFLEKINSYSPMMEFFYKILLSEEFFNKMNILGFIFFKKNQIWSKNLKISFRQFKLTLQVVFFLKTRYLGSDKIVNVALFWIVIQSKPYLWHRKMHVILILTLFRMGFFGAAHGWVAGRGVGAKSLPPP